MADAPPPSSPPPPPPPLLPLSNPLKPRKRLLATPDRGGGAPRTSQPFSPTSSSSIQSRHPNISTCHSCGSHNSNNNNDDNNSNNNNNNLKTRGKLRILDSQWRIVLLCTNCFKDIRTARTCSYCFLRFREEERVRCGNCRRCVHKECVYDFDRACDWYCVDGFACFDCWEPKSNRKMRTCCGNRSRVLVDVAKEAVVKIAAVVRARDNAGKKDEVARRAAAAAAVALDLYRLDADEEAIKNDPLLSVDNSELEERLRRAIDSSPRIFKQLCSANADPLVALKILKADGHLSSRSTNVCRKLDIVSVTKKPKMPNPDFDRSIFFPEYDPCVVLCLPAQRKKVKFSMSSKKKKHMKIGEDGKTGNSVCEAEAGLCKITDGNDTSVALPGKEAEPGDCCRDKVSVDVEEKKCDQPDMHLLKYSKRTQSHSSTCDGLLSTSKEKVRDGSDTCSLKYRKQVQCQSSCLNVLSTPEEKRLGEPDMYVLKYSKRKRSSNAVLTSSGTFLQSSRDKDIRSKKSHDKDLCASQQKIYQMPDMYFYKYSKRHKSSGNSQVKFPCEDFPLRSQPQQLEFSSYS
ncbi:hypothetical protein Scep_018785 [Stephania cephalantha]|uniref:Uncharacterized protein n=1 Tax=Stephania cephalantha TaxID=152367 RepID=A0AAP0NP67_9MAGN